MIVKDRGALPNDVQEFVRRIEANAGKVEGWDDDFISLLLCIEQKDDGTIQICDNFERFFNLVYVVRGGEWSFRRLYSDLPERPYTVKQAMSDADIMYTG